MIVECAAVLVIIILTSGCYFVAKKPNIAISILPLTFVPVMYLLSYPLSKLLNGWWGVGHTATTGFCVLAGAVTACCIFGYLSTKLHRKSSKAFYNIFCTGFTVIFAWIILLAEIL